MSVITTKDRILNAAEALACEVGTATLRLEAVAERADVSKGGLLYHFPSKNALVQAMLARRLVFFSEAQDQLQSQTASDDPGRLRSFLQAGLDDLRANSQFCKSLLAAVVSNPELLEPVRVFLKQKLKELGKSSVGRDQAILLWLAVEGLRFHEMFEVSPLSATERKRITRQLLEFSELKF
jgi:AcrR family transcriptional regulator